MSQLQIALFVVSLAFGAAPPVQDNVLQSAVEKVMPAVVKLYGAGISIEHGYGVGVIVSEDGLVVTASSLLLDTPRLRAVLHDGRSVEASVVRQDDDRQLALVRMKLGGIPPDRKGLQYLTPASSGRLLPGDTVIAIGNAYKVAEDDEPLSVTRGIFSMRTRLRAVRRKQPFNYHGEVLLYDAITSNPGMAGGPLLDLDGNWVGLVGKVVVAEQTNTYMSFALPSEPVADFIGGREPTSRPSLNSATGGATGGRAYTGIKLFEMGLRQSAAYVDSVIAGSPAAKAGLKTDDLILAVDGAQVRSAGDFKRMLAQYRPDQRVTLSVKRGDQVLVVDLVLGAAQ